MLQKKLCRTSSFAVLTMGVLMASSAIAQEVAPAAPAGDAAASETVTEIVVFGTRAGLRKATAVKRNSAQFVDSIIAEDIGKLPDVNVAESLQRVSGVQIKRSLGEGTQVSIRGLTQNLTLVNGRDVVDAAGRGGSGVDSLGTGSYGILAQLPSEIIQRLDVTKLAAASDVEGAMGGTVNIITAKPLDSRQDVRAFSLEEIYSDRGGKNSYRGSVVYSHRFSDRLGGLINLSYSDRQIRDESIFSFSGYLPLTAAFDTGATANHLGEGGTTLSRDPNDDGVPGYYLADIRDTQIDDHRKRLGVNGSLQWRPNENTEIWADLLYSKQDIERDRWWLSTNISGNGSDYSDIVFSPTETVMAGTLNTVVQGNTEYYTNEGTTISTGLGGRWTGERLKISGEVDYSRSKQYALQSFLRDSNKTNIPVSFDFRGVDVPEFNIGAGVDILDPSTYKMTNAFDNADQAISENTAARFDVEYRLDTPFFSAIKAGVRQSKLDVEIDKWQSQLGINVSLDTIPANWEVKTLDILDGASGYNRIAYLSPVLFADGQTLACQVTGTTCTPRIFKPLASFTTSEEVSAAYVQGDIDTSVFGITVKGNAGMRYVETKFTANGASTTPDSASTIVPITVKDTYHDWLPSLSLKSELTDNLLLRFGAAKVIARPNSADQNPGVLLDQLALVQPGATPTGTAGNARLQPFRATQYDLSLEYYFKPASIVSVGIFAKDLESFIISRSAFETFDGHDYLVKRPVNGEGGKIKGIELVYQNNFDFLPSPFDGLGMVANYSFIESETPNISPRTHEELPVAGLSKNNVNLVLYWEKGDYGVRLAYNWRDRFLDSIGAGGDGIFFDSTEDLSLSARWQFTQALSVDAQVSNLMDSRIRQYGGYEEATKLYGLNGRTFSIALRGKF